MKLNIIDCRNQHLDNLLSQSKDPVISVMLPETTKTLPDDIKFALETYSLKNKTNQMSIDITVEVNQWIHKEKALILLRNTLKLINQFFHNSPQSIPKSRLALFEKKELIYIDINNQKEYQS